MQISYVQDRQYLAEIDDRYLCIDVMVTNVQTGTNGEKLSSQ